MITSPAPISSPPELVLHSIEPPDGPIEAPHSHPGLETVLHVVEGVVYLVLDDDERVLTPGDEAIVGPGRLHRRWNAGDEPAHIVEITPPGAMGREGAGRREPPCRLNPLARVALA